MCLLLKHSDGRDACNGDSGGDHTAPCWGATYANELVVRHRKARAVVGISLPCVASVRAGTPVVSELWRATQQP